MMRCHMALANIVPKVPDLDGTVLGARVHPFAFVLEAESSHVRRMAVVRHDLLDARR